MKPQVQVCADDTIRRDNRRIFHYRGLQLANRTCKKIREYSQAMDDHYHIDTGLTLDYRFQLSILYELQATRILEYGASTRN